MVPNVTLLEVLLFSLFKGLKNAEQEKTTLINLSKK